ncbi:hypothetical protein [Rubinisphaera italica]|nr:hypothetical protein [Rubinisphaera italica]
MAAILFGCLVLMRTLIDPGVCFHGMDRPITPPHIKFVAPLVPPLMAYWLAANSIFRTTDRRTATQYFGDETMPFYGNAFLFGPIVGAHVISIYGLPAYRVAVVAWVTAIATLPILLWIVFEPGVFQSFAHSAEKARKQEQKRRNQMGPNYALLLRVLRRDYEDKIHEIHRMRIGDEDREYLEELADNEYRDQMFQVMTRGNHNIGGIESEAIEDLLQQNEET